MNARTKFETNAFARSSLNKRISRRNVKTKKKYEFPYKFCNFCIIFVTIDYNCVVVPATFSYNTERFYNVIFLFYINYTKKKKKTPIIVIFYIIKKNYRFFLKILPISTVFRTYFGLCCNFFKIIFDG